MATLQLPELSAQRHPDRTIFLAQRCEDLVLMEKWIMVNLVKHLDMQEAIGGEVDAAVGEDAEEMGEKDLGRLEYLNADLMEALPLHPSMPSVIDLDTVVQIIQLTVGVDVLSISSLWAQCIPAISICTIAALWSILNLRNDEICFPGKLWPAMRLRWMSMTNLMKT